MTFTVYLIKCKTPQHFYIGMTTNLKHRITQHILGKGAEFTRKYGVRKLLVSWKRDTLWDAFILENELTIKYISLFGYDNVYGGEIRKYTRLYLKEDWGIK